jgi:hypothetical protein
MYLNVYTLYNRRVGARIVASLRVGSLPRNRCFISDRKQFYNHTTSYGPALHMYLAPSSVLKEYRHEEYMQLYHQYPNICSSITSLKYAQISGKSIIFSVAVRNE